MFKAIDEAVKKFKEAEEPIRIISHLDADGIASAAILTKALKRENKKFSLSIVRQVSDRLIHQLSIEEYPTLVFTDLGSGNIEQIESLNKNMFILDHHQISKETKITHINPKLFGIEQEEFSGACLTYLFVKALNEKNKDLAHLAIIGAIGDSQILNKEILEDAKDKIEIKKGLKIFGSQTRSLHKLLEYSTDPYIPGVTGKEQNAIRFLEELNIPLKQDNKWRKLVNLTEEETKKLVAAIIIQRLGSETNPEDIIGDNYLLKSEEDESPTKDLREFSTLLNCCGRLNKPSLGIGTCLNNKKAKEQALELLIKYKQEIINGLNWFYDNKDKVLKENNLVIINAEDNIRDTMVGTINSIISNSNLYKEKTIILSMAHTLDDNTKISIRSTNNKDVNLKEILNKITKKLGYEAGGHNFAAGALIPQEKEEEFIKLALEEFKK